MAPEYYHNGIKQEGAAGILGLNPDDFKQLPKDVIVPKDSSFPAYVRTPAPVGIKHDAEKLRFDLLPFDAVEEVVKTLNYGAAKYGARNWENGMAYGRLIGAAFRHLSAFCRGESKDPESGCYHLASVACNILFLLAFTLRGKGQDDRAV